MKKYGWLDGKKLMDGGWVEKNEKNRWMVDGQKKI